MSIKIKHSIFIIITVVVFFIVFEIIYSLFNSWLYSSKVPRFKTEYVERIKIHYREAGRGEPLLLVHGYMSSLNFFNPVFKELSQRYKVISIDMPGYGLSDKRCELNYTKEAAADLIVKFMHQKSISSFNILGHSMGGEVSLNVAYKYPEAVKKLILVNSTGYYETPKTKVPAFLQKIACTSFTLHAAMMGRNLYNKQILSPQYLDAIYSLNSSLPKETIYKINAYNDSGSLKNKISHIHTPTLVIWGSKDRVVPVNHGTKFSENLPNNKFITFTNTGHMPFFEYKDVFITEIMNFLE